MSKWFGTALAAILMLSAAALSFYWKPGSSARAGVKFTLDEIFPDRFGGWRTLPSKILVVNPQAQELIDKLYSQVLTRTYINDAGYLIMLSVAYGDDQRGDLKAHMPDLCYPSQGFALLESYSGLIGLSANELPVHRLRTALKARKEPVTYWFTYGQQVMPSPNSWQRRVVDLREAVAGRTPDGMLVRVSSIDENATDAFHQQERFIKELVNALPPAHRARVVGRDASM